MGYTEFDGGMKTERERERERENAYDITIYELWSCKVGGGIPSEHFVVISQCSLLPFVALNRSRWTVSHSITRWLLTLILFLFLCSPHTIWFGIYTFSNELFELFVKWKGIWSLWMLHCINLFTTFCGDLILQFNFYFIARTCLWPEWDSLFDLHFNEKNTQ